MVSSCAPRWSFSLMTVIASSSLLCNVVGQSCSAGTVTPRDAEGPFYVPGSPVRNRLAPEDQLAVAANVLHVEGTVYGNDCVPMDTVLLEPWYAGLDDEGGNTYSEAGSDLDYRGQIFTDSCGRYSFTQSFPESYASRPIRHVHFAVTSKDGGSRLLTTQMYFKGDPTNTFTRSDLQMREVIANGDGSRSVTFNMFLDTPGTGDASSCGDSSPGDDGFPLPTPSPISVQGDAPVPVVPVKPSASPVHFAGSPSPSQDGPTSGTAVGAYPLAVYLAAAGVVFL